MMNFSNFSRIEKQDRIESQYDPVATQYFGFTAWQAYA
jgi:hypothetical protein